MQYVLLFVATFALSLQSVFQKQYNAREKKPNPFLFMSLAALFSLLFFVFTSGFSLRFDASFLPYSVGFGLSYVSSLIGMFFAVRYGSLAITMLVISYSLVIPTVHGIVFLHDAVKPIAYVGIVLLLISLFLVNVKKGEATFSVKWLIFAVLGFVGNGMCTTFQKMQQLRFDGEYKSEFMICALLLATVCFLVPALLAKPNGKALAHCAPYAFGNGLCNGIVNLFVMILTSLIPSAILYPTISAGGIVIAFLFALLVYREKLSKTQLIGYAMGVTSVVLLNL